MKQLNIAASVWAILLVLLLVFSSPLIDRLWVLYWPIHWGIALAGGLILMFAVVKAFRGFRPVVVALLITIIGLTAFFTDGFRIGRLAYFQIRKSHYEHLLSDAMNSGEVAAKNGYIDRSPPVRYAFYWVRGVTDNWVGVVYDPTGRVMLVNQANGWDGLSDPRWKDVVYLFGGTLYKSEKLGNHWYLCYFT